MAEYKQYITQIQENGSVMISEDVVATIVAHALSEVEGVGSLGIKPGVSIADFANKKNWGKGLKILEMSAESGNFTLEGRVDGLYYAAMPGEKKGLFARRTK